MDIKIDINASNYKEISQKIEILKNHRHLKILLLLENKEMTSKEVHEILEQERIYVHRENTYQALEKLTEIKIIKKEYKANKKKIFYSCGTRVVLK